MSRDFKYGELLTSGAEWEDIVKGLSVTQSDCLKECEKAFLSNLTRTALFAIFPVEMAFQIRRDALFQMNAVFRATGKGEMSLQELMELDLTEDITRELIPQIARHEQLSQNEATAMRISLGLNYVELLALHNEGMQQTIDAILTSVVLESWLFFEVFVGDLWCSAVDHGGRIISNRINSNQKWESSKEGMKVSQLPQGIQSDSRSQPGSFRREVGLVSFRSLRSMRDYYVVAFENGIGKIFDETADRYIYALSLVRNCIVHSAGKVDGSFEAGMRQFPEFENLRKGNKILFDGALVKKLRNAAALTGAALLKAVDKMLVRGD